MAQYRLHQQFDNWSDDRPWCLLLRSEYAWTLPLLYGKYHRLCRTLIAVS